MEEKEKEQLSLNTETLENSALGFYDLPSLVGDYEDLDFMVESPSPSTSKTFASFGNEFV